MSVSTVPLPASFFHPILRLLAEHPAGVRRRDLHEPIADLMGLTAEQRGELLPSGANLRYRHRLGWGLNILKNAGYIESPTHGIWCITPKGKQLLDASPQRLDEPATRQIDREARVGGSGETPSPDGPCHTEPEGTPEERIESAIAELRGTVATELLQRILQASPTFFEELVLHLLHALGYGATLNDLQHLGGSGDAGIDGAVR